MRRVNDREMIAQDKRSGMLLQPKFLTNNPWAFLKLLGHISCKVLRRLACLVRLARKAYERLKMSMILADQ